MKFYSSYDRPPSEPHKECPKVMDDFVLDEDSGELVKVGVIPFYERIQSYHESTTLSAKLKRFAMGDSLALGTPNNNYGDFTCMPTDLRQVLDSRKKVIEDFNNLSPDIRNIFNNDFDAFEQSVKSGTAERRIYDYLKSNPGGQSSGGQAPGQQAAPGSQSNPGGAAE